MRTKPTTTLSIYRLPSTIPSVSYSSAMTSFGKRCSFLNYLPSNLVAKLLKILKELVKLEERSRHECWASSETRARCHGNG